MRAYYKERRRHQPAREMWERARKRAQRLGLTFSLPKDAITIPDICPALGQPIRSTATRSAQSPSLDRIRPGDGYVLGNVRVLSDYANRLKGADRDNAEAFAEVVAAYADPGPEGALY